MNRHIANLMLSAAWTFVLTAATACSHDTEYVDPNSDITGYSQSWPKRYGATDAAQTWNLARAVTATVGIDNMPSPVTLRIYTAAPSAEGSRLLARSTIRRSGASVTFDVPAGLSEVYATGWTEEGKVVDGSFAIAEGLTAITPLSAPVAGTPEPEVPAMEWIIACEDLSSSDSYSFNDAVFKVSHVVGDNTATITPLAAGSQYMVRISLNGQPIGEIHELINSAAVAREGIYEPINIDSHGTAGQPVTMSVGTGFTLAYNATTGRNMGGAGMQIKKGDPEKGTKTLTILAPMPGTPPQMILVPASWSWPKGDAQIEQAYPDFRNWNQHADRYLDWYDTNVNTSFTVE